MHPRVFGTPVTGILVLIAVAAIVVACTPSGNDNANGGLVNTSWTVVSIAGAPTLDGARPTLTFAQDGTVSGSAGCNQYSGAFRMDGGAISMGELGSTLMGCEVDRSAQEVAFLNALRGATAWRLADDGNLVLSGAGRSSRGKGWPRALRATSRSRISAARAGHSPTWVVPPTSRGSSRRSSSGRMGRSPGLPDATRSTARTR